MSDPKLIEARMEIEAVLKRLDIGGVVLLHNAPDSLEVFSNLHPSYSNLIGDPPAMRLRSKLDDYGGDAKAQERDLKATLNMLHSLAEALARNGLWLLDFCEEFDAVAGATHTPLERDTDTKKGRH